MKWTIFLIALFFAALHGGSFDGKKIIPYQSKNRTNYFNNRPLNIIQERLGLLKNYRLKFNNQLIGQDRKSLSSSDFSIVEPQNQISTFEAKFELANILARHAESQIEALKLYSGLFREKPRYKKLWLAIGRLYLTQSQFAKALPIFKALVYHSPLSVHFLTLNLKEAFKKEKVSQYIPSTLVDLENVITDDQARLELARLFSHNEKNWDKAIQLYQFLMQRKPYDVNLTLEISRLLLKKQDYQLALSYLYFTIEKYPNNPDLLVEAAHAELSLGHAKQSLDLLLRAWPLSKHPEAILMDEANVFMLVGDFYKAIAIYKKALDNHPHALDLALSLAWAFVSAQRYEEAEGVYRALLLENPHHPKVLEALANLKVSEKDFSSALEIIDTLLSLFPQNRSYLQLKVDIAYKKNDTDALEELALLCSKAHLQKFSPIQAQFYQAGGVVCQPEFIQQVINQTTNPKDLLEWANIYAENGMGGMIEFYEAALALDPAYFPAQIGLAEALSANYQYDKALEIYLSLLGSFPENSKIMIAIARVLSWEKHYEYSMEWYDQVIALDPTDPVPRREKARVAYWGKFFEISMATYQSLLQPSVDELLFKDLQNCDQGSTALDVFKSLQSGSIYFGYEELSAQLADCDFSSGVDIPVLLIRYLPLYRIQKSIKLESTAKSLDWQNYYLHALPVYQELAKFNPGNEEGLYGYAQDFCNVDLCRCSRRLYEHILNINPNHELVKMALEKNKQRLHPLVSSNYMYWRERGSGQFSNSQIARQQLDEGYEYSPNCNQHFRLIQHEWLEYPFFKQRYYPAEGQSIEFEQVFNGYIKGFASATRKNYFQRFPTRYTCLSTLWFNFNDYAKLALGFERNNEIYNYFTLKQGIQAKVYWASLTTSTHSWVASATYRHLDYNDRNTLDHVNVLVSYAFTEDPKVIRVIFNGNFRNTAHLTEILTSPTGKLINIIHPYWTPRNYYAGSITLEFRYNYAWFTYCEAPQRYIDIKLTGEDDTAHNPSVQLAINWKHEFMYHWGFEVTGLYHRSKLWNADGIWTQIYYRF